MAQNCAKASERVFNGTTRVDVASLSPQVRLRRIDIDLPATTQATQTFSVMRALGFACSPVSGYAVFRTAPVVSGGTATLLVEYLDAAGSATTLVSSQTVLSKTDVVPFTLTLAATPSMVAGGSIRTSITTSNHAVGTAQVGGALVLHVYPTEDTVISD